MNLRDLPIEIQNDMNARRLMLHETMKVNTSYCVTFVNAEGTRYFAAYRRQHSWNDDKGNYMPFGGGSYWMCRYGKIKWDRTKQPLGNGYDYEWVLTSECFSKSTNGTEIPSEVQNKKQALEIAKQIGIFDI